MSVTMATGMDVPKAWTGRDPLSEADPELQDLIRKEKNRQKTGLELIASEVRVWLLGEGVVNRVHLHTGKQKQG